MNDCSEGSWKTTRSIGRECTVREDRSRPVLTAERLDHPDPPPHILPRRDRGDPGSITVGLSQAKHRDRSQSAIVAAEREIVFRRCHGDP
jgi:hypothetical protein